VDSASSGIPTKAPDPICRERGNRTRFGGKYGATAGATSDAKPNATTGYGASACWIQAQRQEIKSLRQQLQMQNAMTQERLSPLEELVRTDLQTVAQQNK
jgi:hypothetical protein